MAETRCRLDSFVRKQLPLADDDLLNYIVDVSEGGVEEFITEDDVFEALGDVLEGVAVGHSDADDVKNICRGLINILKKNMDTDNTTNVVKLSNPVNIGVIEEAHAGNFEEENSIWIKQQADESLKFVDRKKLEKVEAKIKQKQDKRQLKDNENELKQQLPSKTDAASVNQLTQKKVLSQVGKVTDVRLENFDLSYGNKVLLLRADLLMAFGRRYGLVGRNGMGKTTLLRAISRRDLVLPGHITLLHVEQEVVGDDTLALDSVLECDVHRTNLLKEEARLTHLNTSTDDPSISARLSDVYAEMADCEADKAPSRASVILVGLGFSSDMQKMKTREFSGGWRMRLALARALFTKPDLLLLDEPTNMLDVKAILWLEDYLQSWPTTLLVVSHDRIFLDSVCTDVVHLHSRKLTTYKGNYTQFEKTKTERHTNQQREYEAQLQYRQHLQAYIDRWRVNANRAAQAQSKIKILEKLPELEPVESEPEVVLRLPECDKVSGTVLRFDEMSFHYTEDKPIFSNLDVSSVSDSRIAIVGENGSGKTTLLKLLLGELEPIKGVRHVHRNIRIGYFNQHHVDSMKMNQTSLEVMRSRFPGLLDQEYRRQLGCYGISGELALRPIATLSGGQKSRVAFAFMTMTKPNFFILDEPTNHLDIETVEALGKALQKFNGGVILVSHNEQLIRMVAKEVWLCGNKTVRAIEGGLDAYKTAMEEEFQRLNSSN